MSGNGNNTGAGPALQHLTTLTWSLLTHVKYGMALCCSSEYGQSVRLGHPAQEATPALLHAGFIIKISLPPRMEQM